MIEKTHYDVLVVGGGPAGLSAAISAKKRGANVVIIEREKRIGGILKQCVHDGFGLVRFGEKLAGPEYATRFIREAVDLKIPTLTDTFVTRAEIIDGKPKLTCVNQTSGVFEIDAASLVLATGCRERTDRQVFIHGDRPAGVFTAGLAQYFVNVQGWLPGHKCVILGSGDIGLIMARRLTLEGMEVEGVYEVKSEPSGLSRNVRQCLTDFNIPMHLSTTVTEIVGKNRVEGVWVAPVDEHFIPLSQERRFIPCDTLILSVGLIPENEIAKALGIELDPKTKGPIVDQRSETLVPGVFACGNALHVNDLVDYVSDSGDTAGNAAADFASMGLRAKGEIFRLVADKNFLTAVPQLILKDGGKTTVYFRSAKTYLSGGIVRMMNGEHVVFEREYKILRPPEMERFEIEASSLNPTNPILSLKFEPTGGKY